MHLILDQIEKFQNKSKKKKPLNESNSELMSYLHKKRQKSSSQFIDSTGCS